MAEEIFNVGDDEIETGIEETLEELVEHPSKVRNQNNVTLAKGVQVLLRYQKQDVVRVRRKLAAKEKGATAQYRKSVSHIRAAQIMRCCFVSINV